MSETQTPVRWRLSVISHGHGAAVNRVLCAAHQQLADCAHELVLTINIPEPLDHLDALPASLRARLQIIHNRAARGFGANHNAALLGSSATFVALLDPDLGLPVPIFAALERALANPATGLIAPLAYDSRGRLEDNGRRLATPWDIARRRIQRGSHQCVEPTQPLQAVEWLAGLFMAARAQTFTRIGGFDPRFWMYCEDVDLCLRARQQGFDVIRANHLKISHDARRNTFRRPGHLRWHLQSLWRLWHTPAYAWARKHRL